MYAIVLFLYWILFIIYIYFEFFWRHIFIFYSLFYIPLYFYFLSHVLRWYLIEFLYLCSELNWLCEQNEIETFLLYESFIYFSFSSAQHWNIKIIFSFHIRIKKKQIYMNKDSAQKKGFNNKLSLFLTTTWIFHIRITAE